MRSIDVYKFILARLRPIEIETTNSLSITRPEKCETIDSLINVFNNNLFMNQGLIDNLLVMLATAISVRIKGPPVWIFCVGPSSSGKTTLANCISADPVNTYACSKFTGLFSGLRGTKDMSLLNSINGKTLIIKDFTVTLSGPPTVRDAIFSELRDVYDGTAVAHFKTVNRKYSNINTSIIACVTDLIRSFNQTSAGERFLQVEIDSYWDNNGRLNRYKTGDVPHITKATSNLLGIMSSTHQDGVTETSPQKAYTWGYLNYLNHRFDNDPNTMYNIIKKLITNDSYNSYIAYLGQWVSFARSYVKRIGITEQIAYRPRPELAIRISEQLTKLSVALCVILGVTEPDDNIKRIVRKVALDTSVSFFNEIMIELANTPEVNKGLSREQLCASLGLSSTMVHDCLSDLQILKIIKNVDYAGNKQVGRPTRFVALSDELVEIGKQLDFVKLQAKPTNNTTIVNGNTTAVNNGRNTDNTVNSNLSTNNTVKNVISKKLKTLPRIQK